MLCRCRTYLTTREVEGGHDHRLNAMVRAGRRLIDRGLRAARGRRKRLRQWPLGVLDEVADPRAARELDAAEVADSARLFTHRQRRIAVEPMSGETLVGAAEALGVSRRAVVTDVGRMREKLWGFDPARGG